MKGCVIPSISQSHRAQIARNLQRQRYGYVFGFNMFMALIVEPSFCVDVSDSWK
ncbi:hypothetical protein DPMN_034055 [Dreissena polymorpha]|uniref:Uncharacterized protein n=1 Tax=Dreissena polymorpha TaxID=45954 RepID=A0A9D4M7V6_DREPO|nr:hypothetical protein DPMN_034055 [Dreissena polymorpha]